MGTAFMAGAILLAAIGLLALWKGHRIAEDSLFSDFEALFLYGAGTISLFLAAALFAAWCFA